jgi:hypothetical protein
MKVRNGFVSNSSSSSFMVSRDNVSLSQIDKIMNCEEAAKDMKDLDFLEDSKLWDISISTNFISFDTYMDNFNMKQFLLNIGIPEEAFSKEWRS